MTHLTRSETDRGIEALGCTAAPRVHRIALVCITLVSLYSVVVFLARPPHTRAATLNLAYYLLLMFNTYYSVAFTEKRYHVRCRSDDLINLPLVLLYLALPWLVDAPQWFYFTTAAFFVVALMKYANWLPRVDGDFFLRRKIIANALAALLGLAAGGALLVWDRPMDIVLVATATFAYANVHTLLIDPLYRHE